MTAHASGTNRPLRRRWWATTTVHGVDMWRHRLIAGLFMVVALVLAGAAGGYVLERGGGARPKATGDVDRSLSLPYARGDVEPKAPGALAIDGNGNLFVADDRRNQILERLGNGHFVVVAGSGRQGFSGDGGPAVKAELNDPGGMAFGPGGALYFADSGNKRVRRVALDGTISTVVGAPGRWSGAPTSGERALQAQLSSPADVAFGPDGHLYVADTGDNEVLRLGPGNRLTVIAGDAHLHYAGVYNMGMPATKASPDGPAGLAFDPTGDLFIFGLNTKALLVMDSHGVIHAVVGERPGTGFYPHSSGGMVTAPDGQVLSLDGTSLDRITSTAVRPVVNFTTNEVTRDWKGFLPNGVAVLGDGGIYVDTDGSNGYTRVPGIVEVGERGKGAVIWKG
jgi:hypothetical protein